MSNAARLALSLLLMAHPLSAQEEIADLDLAELTQVKITLATGNLQLLSEAPAVATVITAEEIEAMGASHLGEVLESVPGVHVVAATRRLDPTYTIRGQSGVQVLLLVNGIPTTPSLEAGRSFTFRLPVASIARIEVIRGPGSAVYGADAFAGVINVVTKGSEQIASPEVGVRIGSFETREAWLQCGARRAGWDLTFSLAYHHSDGDPDQMVEGDRQTTFDRLYGTDASLAPGPLSTRYQVVDAHLGLSRDHWNLRLWHWNDHDRGLIAGSAQALDPVGGQDTDLTLADIAWSDLDLLQDWDLSARFHFFYLDQFVRDNHLFPAGTVLPIGDDGNLSLDPEASLVTFPDGFIANPGLREQVRALDAVAVYTGHDRHRFRLAAGLDHQDTDTREDLNFGPGVIDGSQPVVGGSLTSVTDTPFIFMQDQERQRWYLSVQDEWSLPVGLELTAGIRYDDYSDFGDTVNPRIALVWKSHSSLTAKLLYGSAFRAPLLVEQHFINNPVSLGNPDLKPETVHTLELALDYRPAPRLRAVVNLFTYDTKDLISFVPDPGATAITAQNADRHEGHGFEVELSWRPHERFQLQANYSWQHSENKVTGLRIPDVPGEQLYVAARCRFGEDWWLHTRLNWVADRARAGGDPRSEIDDFTLVDLTFQRKRIARQWDLALIVRNVFDEDAREPSDGVLVDDFPLPGRSSVVELRYHF